jgi:DNA-binding NarL/FixJ family response regulator
MRAQSRSIVLAIAAGPLRDGVVALLAALPAADQVELAHDCETALARVAALSRAAVIVDGSLAGMGASELVARLRTDWPAVRSVVLADDVQQQRRLVGAGPGAVLLKGTPPAKLLEVVQAMLV